MDPVKYPDQNSYWKFVPDDEKELPQPSAGLDYDWYYRKWHRKESGNQP